MAVIGAGPKGAAIAAKAAALKRAIGTDIEVTLFDQNTAAGNWKGSHGFTDGDQKLCTPAERDVGFPYDHVFGEETAAIMQAEYSWMAYSVQSDDVVYSDWVNRGGEKATHGQFADYLKFVIDASNAKQEYHTEVVGLTRSGKKWAISVNGPSGTGSTMPDLYDGVVVTGPGPARKTFGTFGDPALFDAEDFWSRNTTIRKLVRGSDLPIVIVGGGGAAAAIAAWLVSNLASDQEIVFLAQQPTFYMRTGGFFENRVFDDEEVWDLLGQREKDDFVNRITRAVVWETVAEKLTAAENLHLSPGRAKSIAKSTGGTSHGVLTVTYRPCAGGPDTTVDACVVVDAAGFDTWWFRKLLPSRWGGYGDDKLKKLAGGMDYQLRLCMRGYPSFHAPTVSQSRGPGFTSLMVLGRMADRILSAYV
ncbi:SidA/IucD/PvdA family monooxygenase [Pseudorhizobium pelagicum]|uniref:SidA/IucD/PvdA family monooxygenase n=1 Tax=Pseudorhizobium pelagicum TaxID=1509405 RepID=UPI00345FBDF3